MQQSSLKFVLNNVPFTFLLQKVTFFWKVKKYIRYLFETVWPNRNIITINAYHKSIFFNFSSYIKKGKDTGGINFNIFDLIHYIQNINMQ